jgi:hypothetical protein
VRLGSTPGRQSGRRTHHVVGLQAGLPSTAVCALLATAHRAACQWDGRVQCVEEGRASLRHQSCWFGPTTPVDQHTVVLMAQGSRSALTTPNTAQKRGASLVASLLLLAGRGRTSDRTALPGLRPTYKLHCILMGGSPHQRRRVTEQSEAVDKRYTRMAVTARGDKAYGRREGHRALPSDFYCSVDTARPIRTGRQASSCAKALPL